MKLDSEWKEIVGRCKELLPKLLVRKMEVEAELKAIDSQVKRLKEALGKYGLHYATCRFDVNCTCGFEQALESEEQCKPTT